jgi:hypothetical protein
MPNEFITIDYLATFAGMVVTVALVVQFTKSVLKKKFKDWVIRLYALAWAWVLQAFLLFVKGNLTVEAVGLAVLNGFLVALAAAGTYETIADPGAAKAKLNSRYTEATKSRR